MRSYIEPCAVHCSPNLLVSLCCTRRTSIRWSCFTWSLFLGGAPCAVPALCEKSAVLHHL